MENNPLPSLGPNKDQTGYKILAQQELGHQIKQVIIHAPEIAEKAKAGQFVILRVDDEGERIPLTLVEWEKARGTIKLIFQEVGVSTKKLGCLQAQDEILNSWFWEKRYKNYGLCGSMRWSRPAALPNQSFETSRNSIQYRRDKNLLLEEEMRRTSMAFVSRRNRSGPRLRERHLKSYRPRLNSTLFT
jgi:hypothetical protein